MKKYPSIALLELSSIAVGIFTADTMVKRASITVLKSGTVHNGKYLILIGGSVGSVEESYFSGIDAGTEKIIDQVQLPDIHVKVHDAILGNRTNCSSESIGIIETSTVAAIIKSTDAAVKGANVDILEIRIADDLGGKAFAIFNGEIEDVQSAIEISKENVTKKEFWLRDKIIPRISQEMVEQINQTTIFKNVKLEILPESEFKMLIGKVIGTLTPAVVYEGLQSVPLLLVQPLDKEKKNDGDPIVCADSTRMAGLDEIIYYEASREAPALALEPWFVPVDHTIIGIIDNIQLSPEAEK